MNNTDLSNITCVIKENSLEAFLHLVYQFLKRKILRIT